MAYNDLSETEKDVSKLEHMDVLDANTDEVEGLLSNILATFSNKLDAIAGKLEIIEGDLVTINSTCNGTTREVMSQGQAIVRAVEGQ